MIVEIARDAPALVLLGADQPVQQAGDRQLCGLFMRHGCPEVPGSVYYALLEAIMGLLECICRVPLPGEVAGDLCEAQAASAEAARDAAGIEVGAVLPHVVTLVSRASTAPRLVQLLRVE